MVSFSKSLLLFTLASLYNIKCSLAQEPSTTQLCFFGPDAIGNYLQKVVSVQTANSCEGCICAPIRETCLLGPDSAGNFATSTVDPEFAGGCPRETCTCSSHSDYVETAAYRLEKARQVFEVQIMKAFDHGIDADKIIDGDIVQDFSTSTVDVPDRQESAEEEQTQPTSETTSNSSSGNSSTTNTNQNTNTNDSTSSQDSQQPSEPTATLEDTKIVIEAPPTPQPPLPSETAAETEEAQAEREEQQKTNNPSGSEESVVEYEDIKDDIAEMLENSSGIAEDTNEILESQDSDDFMKDMFYNITESEQEIYIPDEARPVDDTKSSTNNNSETSGAATITWKPDTFGTSETSSNDSIFTITEPKDAQDQTTITNSKDSTSDQQTNESSTTTNNDNDNTSTKTETTSSDPSSSAGSEQQSQKVETQTKEDQNSSNSDENIFTIGSMDFSEVGEERNAEEATDLIFNGFSMLKSRDQIDCKIWSAQAKRYVTLKMSLIEYEMMCAQAVDENFCQCETGGLKLDDENARENVLNEVFITRTVTKEILVDNDSLSVEKESNQISFVAGIVVTLLVAAIAVLISVMCIKYRTRQKTKIVIRSQQSMDPNQMVGQNQNNTLRIGELIEQDMENADELEGRDSVNMRLGSSISTLRRFQTTQVVSNSSVKGNLKDPDQAPFGSTGAPQRKFTRYAGSGADLTSSQKKMKNVDDDVAVEDFVTEGNQAAAQATPGQQSTPGSKRQQTFTRNRSKGNDYQ